MENPTVKSGLQQPLTNYGCTSRQNEFLVTYTYLFDGDDFTYDVTLTYQNPRYHVEYVDIRVGLGFDLYDVGTTEPPIYTPETHSFALEDNYEDAKTYLSGMVSVTPDTERIYYTLFQTSSRYESATEENYLPIHITVSGLYEFLDQDGTSLPLYSMETRRPVHNFYEAGIYYIRFTHVLYGATQRVMLVSHIPLRDYADMENPIAQNGNTLSLDLESYRDKQAFAFTPSESGIYVFSDTEAFLGFSLYLKSDTQNEILSICQPYLMFYLEEGKEYIITAYLFRQSISDRPTFCGELTLTSVGDPMKEPPLLKEEYQQIFLGNGMQSLLIHIEEAGYYSVDLRYIDGVEEPYGYFADEEGYSDPRAERVTLADGREAYYLSEGDYLFTFSMMVNCYLKGEARLTPVSYEK